MSPVFQNHCKETLQGEGTFFLLVALVPVLFLPLGALDLLWLFAPYPQPCPWSVWFPPNRTSLPSPSLCMECVECSIGSCPLHLPVIRYPI